jgi:hypothetical protein
MICCFAAGLLVGVAVTVLRASITWSSLFVTYDDTPTRTMDETIEDLHITNGDSICHGIIDKVCSFKIRSGDAGKTANFVSKILDSDELKARNDPTLVAALIEMRDKLQVEEEQ